MADIGESTLPENQEESRNPDGTFKKGVSGNPAGRPKGKTIKERVQDFLEEHPEEMDAFVAHFVKTNRELAWQMLEGRPSQGIGQATDLDQITVSVISYAEHNDSPQLPTEAVPTEPT